jgi:hypothetical protein
MPPRGITNTHLVTAHSPASSQTESKNQLSRKPFYIPLTQHFSRVQQPSTTEAQ